jgi:hypothetical protein
VKGSNASNFLKNHTRSFYYLSCGQPVCRKAPELAFDHFRSEKYINYDPVPGGIVVCKNALKLDY